jgi:hypothetical protein
MLTVPKPEIHFFPYAVSKYQQYQVLEKQN